MQTKSSSFSLRAIINDYAEESLTAIINDYVEGELTPGQEALFTGYLASDKQVETFVHQSRQGKRALNHAYHVVAADDFGEKLARRIAQEKK